MNPSKTLTNQPSCQKVFSVLTLVVMYLRQLSLSLTDVLSQVHLFKNLLEASQVGLESYKRKIGKGRELQDPAFWGTEAYLCAFI